MRLSDIIKKAGADQQPPVGQAEQQPIQPQCKQPSVEPQKPQQNNVFNSNSQAPKPAAPPPSKMSENISSANNAYTNAINETKTLISSMSKDDNASFTITCVEQLSNLIDNGNDDIIMLADRATPDVYLYGHCVNVCIYSAMMAKGMGMDRDKLFRLAYASYFHDMCLSKHLMLILRNGKLGPEEVNSVHSISPQCIAMIERNISHLPQVIKTSVLEVMSIMNEQKYGTKERPATLSKESAEFAKLITITDIYEALTHPRPYRDRFLPHDAIKTMISTADNNFDSAMLKSFIEIISLYPLGSYVRLNTDEVARVTGVNRGLPTRPKITIITDSCGNRLPQHKLADLAASPMLFVKEAIDETKLKLADKKLMLELKAIRWWVKSL